MNLMLLSIIIVFYLLSIAYLGFLGYKTTNNSKDYLLAGRSIHPFVMAMSYGATFISTSAIVGFGGVAGLFGLGVLWLPVLNILIGVLIAFVCFGKRTRKIGHNLDVHTFPEFLGKRFGSRSIQVMCGLIVFCAMPLYASVVLIGGARFIEQTLSMNFHVALLVFSVIIAAYVITGGLKGVMYADAFQGSIMFVGILFLFVMTYVKLGGVTAAHEALGNLAHLVPDKLKAIGHLGWTEMPGFYTPWWWTLCTSIMLGVGIGVLAQPQLIVRFMTVKSNRELNRAVLIGAVFICMATGGVYIVGALTNVFFHSQPETLGQISIQVAKGNTDLIIPTFINAAMPSWFVYLFMLALLSAAMSTVSSQFHNMGTSIGRDVFEVITGKEGKTIFITKAGIILAILISIVLGYMLPAGIIARGTAIFFGICAASFLPVYMGALYWKGGTKAGAKFSILTGLGVSLFCLFFMHKKEAAALGLCKFIFGREVLVETYPWPFIDPIVIALPLSAIVFIAVSLLTKPVSKKYLSLTFKGIS